MSFNTPILTTLSSASAEVAISPSPTAAKAASAAERRANAVFMINSSWCRDGSLAVRLCPDLIDKLWLAAVVALGNASLCRPLAVFRSRSRGLLTLHPSEGRSTAADTTVLIFPDQLIQQLIGGLPSAACAPLAHALTPTPAAAMRKDRRVFAVMDRLSDKRGFPKRIPKAGWIHKAAKSSQSPICEAALAATLDVVGKAPRFLRSQIS